MGTAIETLKRAAVEKAKEILSHDEVTDRDINKVSSLLSELSGLIDKRQFNSINKL